MFLWSIQILLEPVTYAGMLYLLYAFAEERDVPLRLKLFVIALFLPLIAITPTKYLLPGFDLANCIPVESYYSFYSYALETVFVLWIVVYAFSAYRRMSDTKRRAEVLFLTVGVILFLLSFASGNIIGSLTGDWDLAQVGLFGMPVFVAFVGYSIVRFQTFNVKVFATQALVIALWFLLFAALFVRTEKNIRIVIIATLIMFAIFGYQLVRSVRREVEQREEIEHLADTLKKANERLKELDQLKSEFVSIASHQLRSPLTAIKGYASLLLEGSFGAVGTGVKEAIQKIFDSSMFMTRSVDDFLNVSRIEQGKMKYEMADFDVCDLAKTVVEELRPVAKEKHLTVSFSSAAGGCQVHADAGKIKQVVENLVDNAIKYTKEGSVRVSVEKDTHARAVRLAVSDTGVGIPAEARGLLFEKFARAKNANSANVSGTGLGLYVAKQFVEAHKGKIWVESEGEGKGSTFYVEHPALP